MITLNNYPFLKNLKPNRFFLLAGPCVIEDEESPFKIAETLVKITKKLDIPFVFKGSYRKANRSRLDSFQGIGDEKALNVLKNISKQYNVPVVITLNAFSSDTEAEVKFVKDFCEERNCEFALSKVWEFGGEGGIELANAVLKTLEEKKSNFAPIYEDSLPLKEKIETVAKKIYGAKDVNFSSESLKMLDKLTDLGFGNLPVCIAKTQYSLSDDAPLLGRPENFTLNVREVYISAGAGFVVVLTGQVVTMPGLPKEPAAHRIDVNESGLITGLF